MVEELEKQADSKPRRNEKGQLLPGNTANPLGRPKGKTLKEFAREYYFMKTDAEKIAYIEKVEKKKPGFAWTMAEGMPSQQLEADVKGNITVELSELIAKKYKIDSNTSAEPDSGEPSQI